MKRMKKNKGFAGIAKAILVYRFFVLLKVCGMDWPEVMRVLGDRQDA